MTLKNASILVVDDDVDMLTAIHMLLKTEVKNIVTEKNPDLTKDLLKMFTVMVERMIKTRRNFHGKLED